MHSKSELLSEFYSTVDRTQVKIETKSHGFDYLQELSKIGTLKYGEWKNDAFKYKLTDLKPTVFDELLKEHLDSKINLCVFFNETGNNIFCFNLDSFGGNINNIKTVARFLSQILNRLQIRPLILISGHGYHFWCRTSSPVENSRLRAFMKAVLDVAVFQAVVKKINISKLQCICYPRFISHDISIRLFGSLHTATGNFTSVVVKIDTEDELLDDENSWLYFENYIKNHTVSNEQFENAFNGAMRLASIIK
jgi:hypothetical protein